MSRKRKLDNSDQLYCRETIITKEWFAKKLRNNNGKYEEEETIMEITPRFMPKLRVDPRILPKRLYPPGTEHLAPIHDPSQKFAMFRFLDANRTHLRTQKLIR